MRLSSSLLTLPAFTVLAIATPAPTPQAQHQGCPTGSTLQCCQTVVRADAPVVAIILDLLDIVLPNLNVFVGLHCFPVLPGPGPGSNSW